MPVKSLDVRFAARLPALPPTDCWPWPGRRSRQGYGMIGHENKNLKAHRVSYELHVGPIPAGLFVLHSCDNPPCVNPAHLSLGDNAQNLAEAGERGLMRQKLTPDQVRAMRQRRADGVRNRDIAKEFGVGEPWASTVTRGLGRKYVQPEDDAVAA